MLELAVRPDAPGHADEVDRDARLLRTALDHGDLDQAVSVFDDATARASASGARRLVLSAEPAEGPPAALAAQLGLTSERELLQLRRPLPLDEHATVAVRAFAPGRDDDAWLAVNNRAFAWHPDQSDWTPADLDRKTREPWFDPSGFLVHEVDGRIAAFCWTKVHADTDPPLGEIFVIAVDPDFHGRGLGRQLTLAGLDWLGEQGLPIAMLYVEADNAPARHLYEELGFSIHHTRRWWSRDLSPEREG